MRGWRVHVLAWLVLMILPACEHEPAGLKPIRRLQALVVSVADTTATCRDIGGAPGVRACYTADQLAPAGVVQRAVPQMSAPTPMGWRCTGALEKRSCRDRSDDTTLFKCDAARCVQTKPRVPDVNEWTCADAAGAQLCLVDERAAGVIAGERVPGYVCGPRIVGTTATQQDLCLDLSPDFPDGDPSAWSCHYEGEPSLSRICLKRPTLSLGAKCRSKDACPRGAVCASRRCVPKRLTPSCWLDSDCPTGQCRLGSCV